MITYATAEELEETCVRACSGVLPAFGKCVGSAYARRYGERANPGRPLDDVAGNAAISDLGKAWLCTAIRHVVLLLRGLGITVDEEAVGSRSLANHAAALVDIMGRHCPPSIPAGCELAYATILTTCVPGDFIPRSEALGIVVAQTVDIDSVWRSLFGRSFVREPALALNALIRTRCINEDDRGISPVGWDEISAMIIARKVWQTGEPSV